MVIILNKTSSKTFDSSYVVTLRLSSLTAHFNLIKRSKTFLKPSLLLKSIEYTLRYRFVGLVCTIATQSLHQEFHFHHQGLSFLLEGLTKHFQLVEIWIYSFRQDYQVWRQFNSWFLSYRISEILIVVVHLISVQSTLTYRTLCISGTRRNFCILQVHNRRFALRFKTTYRDSFREYHYFSISLYFEDHNKRLHQDITLFYF